MSAWITFLNDTAVSFFGSILTASFCSGINTKKKRCIFVLCMLIIPVIQVIIYAKWDAQFLRKIYPIVIHLPLLCLMYFLTKKFLWSFIAVMTAYLCCQMRRWLSLLAVAAFAHDNISLELVELIWTLPLLILLLRYASPSIRRLSDYPVRNQCQFGIIPLLYYLFDYITMVYTNLLLSGKAVVVEFMPFVCSISYIVFLVYDYAQLRRRIQLQQVKNSMGMQLSQAVREIDALRQSQLMAKQYRHDLRHHLQYISDCIENGKNKEAQKYITSICDKIENQSVRHYCENETANLILSSFVSRAEKYGIQINISGSITSAVRISDSDLCVILSNALENAINASRPIAKLGQTATVEVMLHENEDKLLLQIKNPYCGDIIFEKGIPVSKRQGHGIGVTSICTIAERYGGVCSFNAKDGEFTLQLCV